MSRHVITCAFHANRIPYDLLWGSYRTSPSYDGYGTQRMQVMINRKLTQG